jgi:Na+/melibiose symporter-like transporter
MILNDLVLRWLIGASGPSSIKLRDYREVAKKAILRAFGALLLSLVIAVAISMNYKESGQKTTYLSSFPGAWRFFCTMMIIIEICVHAYLASYFRSRR